ncbi:hypothetical protein ACFQFH_15905 [Halobaculum halobium]|uniref:DUF7269 family protein n=1 Tax=Halobaculum halobium TaxID=3032281 RepID=UPI00360926D7
MFDLTYVFVTGAGVLALVQGLRYANDARTAEHRAVETGDPEDRYEVPAPGDDDDELITRRGYSRASIKRRREFHRHLRQVAEETLRARGDFADSEVATAIDDGGWTDDPVAAWFLGADVPQPPGARLRRLLGTDAEFRYGVVHTVDALVAASTGASVDTKAGARVGGESGGADGARDAASDAAGGKRGRRSAARHLLAGARRAGRRRVASARDTLAEVRR